MLEEGDALVPTRNAEVVHEARGAFTRGFAVLGVVPNGRRPTRAFGSTKSLLRRVRSWNPRRFGSLPAGLFAALAKPTKGANPYGGNVERGNHG